MAYEVAKPSVAAAEQLAILKADTFRESFAAGNDPAALAMHIERAFSVEAVVAQLADPDCETTWILDGTEPVAYLKLNRGSAQTEPGLESGLEVEQIYVRKAHHGRGLGGLLLDLAVETARRDAFGFVWLGVWEQNHNAISLYLHRGFKVFDNHVFMFGTEPQTDLMMRLELA